jgi:hypothetical protein
MSEFDRENSLILTCADPPFIKIGMAADRRSRAAWSMLPLS